MSRYEGDLSPKDSREVTQQKSDNGIEPKRTGPQEGQTHKDTTQPGYGNAQTDGQTEQDTAKRSAEKSGDPKAAVGETSPNPEERARADGSPPLV